ncbi:family 43 glycosylhydrolase [Aestuariibaculum sediminum]|uniref:Family 43 glycosylhydrolase n=1 Tax=Aestuariibaculum sediminum TaxID=2770637 RepID=A0A8J6QA51_9FLAO|nr:family 43 glycosylhydrolase [Aestuariibaculum sediminum]MBD0831561.1 family 43 glycosylhydrolase [Aestuariibaculum sediminum]
MILKFEFIKKHISLSILLLNLIGFAQFNKIKNDQFWSSIDEKPIYSQGGGIFKFPNPNTGEETYYWYGVHYKEAELYRNNPDETYERNNFVSVTCYSSKDLVNWNFENNVLERKEIEQNGRTGWLGRMGVAYVPEKKQYALFIQHNNSVLIALSHSPTGQFKKHNRLDMTEMIGTPNTGDQTIFTDYDTGKSYLVYSYGRGRNKIYISEIGVKNGKVDLLDCNQIYKGKGREGNCMFKYNNKYYVFASNLYGWDSSYAYYLVSDNIKGPYLPHNEMLITPGCMDDFAHITQTGFFINIKGNKKETVMYCGDRWAEFAGNGLGYNQWTPLSFEGETPIFNSLNSWHLNETTGEWQVAEDNNYVKNPSFEADRRAIPSPVKPIQEHITGWVTKVYQGNVILVGDSDSPQLNYFNSQEDRKYVIGEKSLNIEDKIPFKRKIYQIIESTPYVNLPNALFNLKAKIKHKGNFNTLNIYAESAGIKKELAVNSSSENWTEIVLKNIPVKNGKIEIGFYADGEANASCQIDDVTLIKSE